MFVNNPIPRNPMARMREGSRLASPRESNSIFNAWKHNDAAINRASQLTGNMSQLQRQVSSLRTKQLSPEDFYPFKIYQLPPALRDPYDPTTDYKKFRVRGGYVEMRPDFWDGGGSPWNTTQGASVFVPLTGTGVDLMAWYRDEMYFGPPDTPFADSDIDLALPGSPVDVALFYIQLNQDTAGTPGVTGLSATLNVVYDEALNDTYNYYDINSPDKIMLGFVEFDGGVLDKITNYLSGHVINRYHRDCTRWRSHFDTAAFYYPGDIVIDDTYTDLGGYYHTFICTAPYTFATSGGNYPNTLGAWENFGIWAHS